MLKYTPRKEEPLDEEEIQNNLLHLIQSRENKERAAKKQRKRQAGRKTAEEKMKFGQDFKEKPSEEGKPTKFNMDLAYQELLHKTLTYSTIAALAKEPIGRFMGLRQSRVMVSPGMHNTKQKESQAEQKKIKAKVDKFADMLHTSNLRFDEEQGDYAIISKGGFVPVKHSKEFVELREELLLMMDAWEEKLRLEMKKMGLFLLKTKTGIDAAQE